MSEELIKKYPNLAAVLQGTVSGKVAEWPGVRAELFDLLQNWNTRPDSKPYKWADEYEWMNAHLTMYNDCMLSAFNAGRERKEK